MEPIYVGIDVAKDRLDVHVRPSDEAFAVARDGEGLAALVQRLAALASALIVLEATGGFEVTAAAALAGANLPLAVVNPRQIRDFARATGRLAKTDALDAAAIARFAEAIRPQPRPLPDDQARALGEMVARRRQIIEMIVAEGNRRRQLTQRRLINGIDRHLAVLQKELTAIESDLDAMIRATPAWREKEDLLTTVPGKCAAEYQGRISGPSLDRIDLHVDVPTVEAADLALPPPAEGSGEIAARVAAARAIQRERCQGIAQGGEPVRCNAQADGELLDRVAAPDAAGKKLLTDAASAMRLSARGYHRVLRVARTLADLEGAQSVKRIHVAEALSYRRLQLRA